MARELNGSFLRWTGQAPPPILYHYTSLDAFVKILDSGVLWASDVRYLNDASEHRFIPELVETRIDGLIATAKNEELDRLEDLKRQLDEIPATQALAICFSTKRDDLSQWRGYTPDRRGISIGFSSKALIAKISYPVPHTEESSRRLEIEGVSSLTKVIYLDPQQSTNFDKLIAHRPSEKGVLPGITSTQFLALTILGIAPYYKHVAFESEDEWRILLGTGLSPQNAGNLKFRQGNSTLIPYSEFHYKTHDQSYIKEIVVGPTPSTSLSVAAVKQMLIQHGLGEVTVSPSGVPYRSW